MTLLPVEPVRLRRAPDGLPFIGRDQALGGVCANPFCGNQPTEVHHIVRRSYSGDRQWVLIDGEPQPNLCGLCNPCHELINRNKAKIEWAVDHYQWKHEGQIGPCRLGYDASLLGEAPGHPDATEPGSFPEQDADPVRAAPPSLAEAIPVVASAAPHVHPGEKCPTCERKFPHPKKPSSPTSKTKSFRLPVDVADSYDELVEAAAEHLGIAKEPFAHFNAVNAGLVLVLQSEAGLLKKEAA
jgi:hypothetical protein